MNGHAAVLVERVFHQGHERPGERFQRGVIVGRVLQHGGRDGKHDALGCEAPSGENVVDQKAVDSTIAVLERVQKNESIGDGGGVNHRGHVSGVHTLVGGYQAVHQVGQVLWFRTREVDRLLLPGDRLADIVLVRPVIGIAKSWIDNAILNLDQLRFSAEVLFFRHLKQGHETLGPGRGGFDMFDLKGRFRLLGVEIPKCPLQNSGRIARHHLPAAFGQIGLFEIREAYRCVEPSGRIGCHPASCR